MPPTDRTQTNTSIIHEAPTTLLHDESRAQMIDTALVDIKPRMATTSEIPEKRITEKTSLVVPNTILIVIGISLEERSQVQASQS